MRPHQCRSSHRCNQPTCETCAWRHTWHVARKVLETWSGPFYGINLTLPDPSPTAFLEFRVEMRNRVHYLRRKDGLWRAFGLQVYRCSHGVLRGISTLGALGPKEALSTLGGRWPITLQPTAPENFRLELRRCIRPSVIAPSSVTRGGYQAHRFSISPDRPRPCRGGHMRSPPLPLRDAMPVLVL
jgi:hypothetical protein